MKLSSGGSSCGHTATPALSRRLQQRNAPHAAKTMPGETGLCKGKSNLPSGGGIVQQVKEVN
jgi:hypothetical protein